MSLLKNIYWDINQRYYNLQKSLHELKTIAIEITSLCNLQCKHCYMNSKKKSTDDLTTEEWNNFFSQLKKDFGNKLTIAITWGEPLVRQDIFEILSNLKIHGFNVNLSTNGILLNKDNVWELKKYIYALSISLDWFDESHNYLRQSNVFDKTLENIKLCKELNYLVVKTTIYKKNIWELEELYKLMQDLQIQQWHLFPMEPMWRAKENQKEILSKEEYNLLCEFVDKIKTNKKGKLKIRFSEEGSNFMYDKTCDYCKFKLCNAWINSSAILYNGDIVSCMQSNRNNIQGNIKTDNFKQIWETRFLKNRQKDYKSCDNHYF